MEKEFSLIGRLLYDTRRELGFTQEEVCHGLCSKSFFSRIEKGESEPDYLLVEALFTRMGVDAPKGLVPLTLEKFNRIKIHEELNIIADSRSERRLELLKEYKKGSPLNKFERQIYALNKGWYISQFDDRKEESIKIYEEALKLTLNDFCVKSDKMPKTLLSRYEIALINNIAHAEYYIYEKNKSDTKRHDKALLRIKFLKNYYECHIRKYKDKTMYSVILFNLTNWTGLDGKFLDAELLARKGYYYDKKSFWYHAAHLFNIGFNLAEQEKKECKDILRNSLGLIKYMDNYGEYEYLLEEIKKRFNITFDSF